MANLLCQLFHSDLWSAPPPSCRMYQIDSMKPDDFISCKKPLWLTFTMCFIFMVKHSITHSTKMDG